MPLHRLALPTTLAEWDGAGDGRKRRAMKDLEPKTAEYLSAILVELFGPAGLKVANLERREEEERRKERLAYYDALAEVQ